MAEKLVTTTKGHQVLGEAPLTPTLMPKLACILMDQGQLKDAEEVRIRIMLTRKTVFGEIC